MGPDRAAALAESADGGGTADATAAVGTRSTPAARRTQSKASESKAAIQPFATNFGAGSLIIPMDVTYQDTGMLLAFGLLDKLLRAGIRVNWIIDPNKVVVDAATGTFSVDMTASAIDFQTNAVISNYGYRGGPFVINSSNAAQAAPIITTWQKTKTTTVHVATLAFSAPVARTLTVAPRIAVLDDNNQQIAFSYLNAAGILDENNLAWSNTSVDLLLDTAVTGTLANPQDGILFGNVSGGQPQYCEIMTMHWDVTSTDIPGVVAEMNSFLNYPVHVNAECQAVNAVEGAPPDGGRENWLTTQGYEWPAPKQPMTVQFSNSQLPFAQMDGPFATVGGSEPAYGFGPGSSYYFQDNVMIRAAGVGIGVQDLWMTGYAHGSCDIESASIRPFSSNTCLGKVSYLGGHQYGVNTPMSKNPQSQGARLFLNSLYEAACVTGEGQPVITLTKSAPSSVASADVTYTIAYWNTGPGPALAFTIKDAIPTGSTFVSASSPGTFVGGFVTWSLGDLPRNSGGSVSFVVALPAEGTYTNRASSSYKVGNNTLTTTSNTTTTVWGSCGNDSDCPPPLVCDTTTSQCVQCTSGEPQNCAGLGTCLPNDTCGCTLSTDCPTGDTCVSGKCETCAQSCTSGCCGIGSTCTPPSVVACGTGGVACVVCDPSTTDSCTAGNCTCGSHPACGSGQQCVGGTCVCDAASCASGCCSGATCNTPSLTACGTGGASCFGCNAAIADGCNGGQCSCGSGAACGAGQACVGGVCVCNAASCPTGCCAGATCTTPSPVACGTGGAACIPCSGGSQCVGGACEGCSLTCTTGCCAGNTCTTPSAAACGAVGGACTACDPLTADTCTGGACTCGSGSPCASGQQCVNGACACNATSCPTGCCKGTSCTIPSASACGTAGSACVVCGDGGAQCLGGVCEGCSQTCTTGCCSGNTCNQPSTATCGAGGGACTACDPGTSDSCTNGTCTCGTGSACTTGQQCLAGTCVAPEAGADGGGDSGGGSGSSSGSSSGSGSGSSSGSGSGSGSGSSSGSDSGSGSGSSSGSDSGSGSGSSSGSVSDSGTGSGSGSGSGGDSGTGSGSGVDSGSGSGGDSGMESDGGSGSGGDSGSISDSGSSSGSGSGSGSGGDSGAGSSSGADSGSGSGSSSGSSSGAVADSGSADGETSSEAGTSGDVQGGGCGCKTATVASSGLNGAAWGLVLLGVALARRRRR